MAFKFKNLPSTLIGILVIIFFTGCIEQIQYSETPAITFKEYKLFKGFNGRDSLLKITFEFVDGDGDLGLAQKDTLPPFDQSSKYYFNMFIDYYERIDTQWRQVTISPFSTDTVRFDSRFPDLTPNTNSKTIKGEMEWTLDKRTFGPIYSNLIKFRIMIYDRALHPSNQIETPQIYFNP
jgi:hypothetical protein